jgi:hypothetical protein
VTPTLLDEAGRTRLEQNLPARPDAFLDAIAPYRDGLVVGCECMFAWYWLADLCKHERIPFVLGQPSRWKSRRPDPVERFGPAADGDSRLSPSRDVRPADEPSRRRSRSGNGRDAFEKQHRRS